MDTNSCAKLADRELIEETVRAASAERQSTATLIALLTEVDVRHLYLAEGCSSLFTYCTQVLRLSEHAAYHRIEAARAARCFPVILDMLADGAVSLTAICLLRPHLTPDNHQTLLTAAIHKSRREVEHQIACLAPRADVRPLVRRHPVRHSPHSDLTASPSGDPPMTPARPTPSGEPSARPVVTALAPQRYLLKVTVSGDTHAKLRRAQDLLRHAIPNGDPAAILDRALTVLVEQLERTKLAAVARPRSPVRRPRTRARARRSSASRHIPAAVRRAVWRRDRGRCAFVGTHGRCAETGLLEFHHVMPFADGGPPTVENVSLRCRAHNQYETEIWEGRAQPPV